MKLSVSQLLVFFFIAAIVTGTVLLSLPVASQNGQSIGFVNALFTATSGVCVTGLIVVQPGLNLSVFGQIVLLVLIQLGGLGYMTLASSLVVLGAGRLSFRNRMAVQEVAKVSTPADLRRFSLNVIRITVIAEFIGAVLLARFWWPQYGIKSIYYGVFHSISAFCNAGFSLFPESLIPWCGNWYLVLVMGMLIIMGGLGYVVVAELSHRKSGTLSAHSKAVLSMSGILLVVGFLLFFLVETKNGGVLSGLSPGGRVWASIFQSLTPRTAGFTMVQMSSVSTATFLVIIIFMFIGASPGGTGGGIKTTTFLAVLATVTSTLRGRKEVVLFNRRLPEEVVRKALSIGALVLAVAGMAVLLLQVTESASLRAVIFEVFSALGTVGLSCGITQGLSTFGKIVLIVVMFVGRVGPVTLGAAMLKQVEEHFHWPEEPVMVG